MPGQAMPTNTKDQAKTMPGLEFSWVRRQGFEPRTR
jgi:hypothetical protein